MKYHFDDLLFLIKIFIGLLFIYNESFLVVVRNSPLKVVFITITFYLTTKVSRSSFIISWIFWYSVFIGRFLCRSVSFYLKRWLLFMVFILSFHDFPQQPRLPFTSDWCRPPRLSVTFRYLSHSYTYFDLFITYTLCWKMKDPRIYIFLDFM